jgi:hypothetical protein
MSRVMGTSDTSPITLFLNPGLTNILLIKKHGDKALKRKREKYANRRER